MTKLTKTIILSDRTHRHLGRFAKGTMGGGATPLPGGFWQVPVDDEISARINELRQRQPSPLFSVPPTVPEVSPQSCAIMRFCVARSGSPMVMKIPPENCHMSQTSLTRPVKRFCIIPSFTARALARRDSRVWISASMSERTAAMALRSFSSFGRLIFIDFIVLLVI